jgi:hypothetical protein
MSHYPFDLQYGGAAYPYNAYRGKRYQYGDGLGDVLRGIGRFLLPIVAPIFSRATRSFIGNTSNNLASGQSLRDASRNSIAPLLEDTLNEAKSVALKRMRQSGSGHASSKPKYARFVNPPPRPPHPPRAQSRQSTTHTPVRQGAIVRRRTNQQQQQSGRGKKRKRVYKRSKRSRKSTTRAYKAKSRKSKYTNF